VWGAGEGGKRAAKLKFPGFTNFYRGKNSGHQDH
jgi:hypothetical protein